MYKVLYTMHKVLYTIYKALCTNVQSVMYRTQDVLYYVQGVMSFHSVQGHTLPIASASQVVSTAAHSPGYWGGGEQGEGIPSPHIAASG